MKYPNLLKNHPGVWARVATLTLLLSLQMLAWQPLSTWVLAAMVVLHLGAFLVWQPILPLH